MVGWLLCHDGLYLGCYVVDGHGCLKDVCHCAVVVTMLIIVIDY